MTAHVGLEYLGDILGTEDPDDRLANDDLLANERTVRRILGRAVMVQLLQVVFTCGR